ncbi:EAL domain-containing protein (putative c-di-GMP-specific phosphodiesterase class I)/GGDEF domain-containing protein [Sphingomonas insulae]|uniref:EAL domain-containing protein n=1 Tax=Sphingomonas insulae TaxID=424800 RepID=A0ABN1HST0_9SPHN|nr:EAL domain-containing protein [Sphingomonas insulae]NIJ28979.1 EAL domain-containing protein (putative c-di-GMP-specific phosphodiesterase class I)/GGDEF domain-containing protein [Sphingomonas insulae]
MRDQADRRTLFIVSAEAGEALAACVRVDGWRIVVDGGGDGVAGRALASGADVMLVDTRADAPAGAAATQALGGLAAATGRALIALTADTAWLEDLLAVGATHFSVDRGDAHELRQAIRYAAGQVQRDHSDRRGPRFGANADPADVAAWIDARLDDGEHVGVSIIALSRLDILNAARGRAAGDTLIAAARAQVEAVTRGLLGPAAMVAAAGGGDMIVASAAPPPVLARLAAALDAALAKPLPIRGRQAVLGSRWGMAESGPADDAASLLRRAAEALVAAKASDGATVRVAGPEGAAPLDLLAIDLHLAIERGEIDVLFQPQAPIDGRHVTGVEALARWRHGKLGPLGADALFAAADRADLGVALSDHIQELVLARVARWPRPLAGLRVSLNLTAGDLGRPGFAALFLDRVAASGVPFERLTVEITEGGAIRNLEIAAAVLATLREAGVRVALDDFGTGYSSLAYLTALPLDYLKLDKALACGIEATPRHRGVVRAVMTLARSLGLAVIAEGIESEAQRVLLAAEGCTFYQGFLLAEPLDEAALIAMMEMERC